MRLSGAARQLSAQESAPPADPTPTASDLVDTLVTKLGALWADLRAIDPLWFAGRLAISVLVIGLVLAIRFALTRVLERLRQRLAAGEESEESGPWRALRRAVDVALLLVTILILAEAWGAELTTLFTSGLGLEFAKSVAGIFLVLLMSFVAWQLGDELIRRAIERRVSTEDGARQGARLRTLIPVLRGVSHTVIMTFAILLVLSELGVNLGPLLAGAGIVGLAVGFGAQSLVKDFLVGVMLLLEDAATIGDVVQVGSHAGIVEHMGIRVMRLRDLEGIVHMIPYSEVSIIKNFTKEFAYALLDVGVAYREDVDEVVEVLRQLAAEMREDPDYGPKILDDLEVLGVNEFADSAVMVRIRLKTRPIEQWSVGREYRRRIKKRFDELDIEIPFPHRTLYFGVGKDGEAPAARLSIPERPQSADD